MQPAFFYSKFNSCTYFAWAQSFLLASSRVMVLAPCPKIILKRDMKSSAFEKAESEKASSLLLCVKASSSSCDKNKKYESFFFPEQQRNNNNCSYLGEEDEGGRGNGSEKKGIGKAAPKKTNRKTFFFLHVWTTPFFSFHASSLSLDATGKIIIKSGRKQNEAKRLAHFPF